MREPLLFIFELANNHNGDVEHGIRVIEHMAEVAEKYPFDFAFKFQYRSLETLIHKDYRDRLDLKYIRRFTETKLSEEEFLILKRTAEKNGFRTICTPFDEEATERVVAHGYDIIKIASCSFTDWPLLEKIASYDRPVIASSAGASLEEIDRVVMFFKNRSVDFTLMHCVGEYPTEDKNLHLSQIDFFRNRYPGLRIGFSTHESPENTDSIKIAIAKGAKVFERHVGLDTKRYPINAYSSTPKQVDRWLKSAAKAMEICGLGEERKPFTQKEIQDLRGLKRGVFAKKDLKVGDILSTENVYYAIPCEEGQLLANDLSKYHRFTLKQPLNADQKIQQTDVEKESIREKVLQAVNEVAELLKKSDIALPEKLELEISHHYGLERFREYGAAIVNIINREYCKKLIILLPGQKHPMHYHCKKEETFHMLYGSMQIRLDGEEKEMKKGDLLTVERRIPHGFASKEGCVFEEISTTHYKEDSFYEDEQILENPERKTLISIRL